MDDEVRGMRSDDNLDRVREALERAEADGDAQKETALVESLGDIYLSSDNYEQALAQYKKVSESRHWHAFPPVAQARLCYKTARTHLGMGELERALRLVSKAERLMDQGDEPLLLGKIYALSGQINRRIGNHRDALAFSLRALDVLRHTPENREIASVQLTCGSIFLRQGDFSEAVRYFQDSLATYRRIQDEEGIAKAYNNLGVAYKNLCQWDSAEQSLGRAIEIDRRLGNYAGVALRSLNLGLIQFQRGDWEGSARRTEESLRMSRGVKDSMGVTLCSLALARIARHRRQWDRANRHAMEALRLSRNHGGKREIAAAFEEIGAWYFGRGQLRTAAAFFKKSLAVARGISEKSDHEADVNRRLSELATAEGRIAEAIDHGKRALKVAVAIRDRRLIGLGLRSLAAACRAAGKTKRASFYANRSVQIFDRAGIPFEMGRSLLESATIAQLNDDFGTARSQLAQAETVFLKLGADAYSCRVLIEFACMKIRSDRIEDSLVLLQKAERFLDPLLPGEDAERIYRLKRSIEDRFVECSLSAANRFLAFRESLQSRTGILGWIVRQLGADCGFLFLRVGSGKFEVAELHNLDKGEAVRRLAHMRERSSEEGRIAPAVSLGGSLDRSTNSFLVAPMGAMGDAGIYVERTVGSPLGLFSRRDLNFLVGVARGLDPSDPRVSSSFAGTETGGFEGVITRSKKMLDIVGMLRKLAGLNATILLQGETGTGKGLLAYELSKENPEPFVTINCADLTETILESELFGHVKSAFTGASTSKKGLFEVADGGTVFIDEIDKTSRRFQEKLLRVVDRREFKPVGSVMVKRVDCRIVCASNRDLLEEVEKRRFLKDLYYRLRVVSIQIPPLRERQEDIPPLVDHFLKLHSSAMCKEGVRFSEETVNLFSRYHWPGNVRDLENEVERAVALASPYETIGVSALSDELIAFSRLGVTTPVTGEKKLARMVEELEERVIREALKQSGGNKSETARRLGLTRKGLRNKIVRFGLE